MLACGKSHHHPSSYLSNTEDGEMWNEKNTKQDSKSNDHMGSLSISTAPPQQNTRISMVLNCYL